MAGKIKQKTNRTARRKHALVASSMVLIALGSGAASTAAWAQTAATSPSNPLSVAYTADNGQADLLQGQNKNGPYSLAWNNLTSTPFEPVTVQVDGRTLATEEFTIDLVKGQITFRDGLKSGSLARVRYFRDVKKATRNADYSVTALTVPLVKMGETNLSLTALPSSATDGNTRLVYGMDRKLNLLNGGLTTQGLFSNDGAAEKVGYTLGNDKSGLDAQFLRTEKNFASRVGKGVGYSDAMQKLSLGARLRAANWLGTNVTRWEQKDLTGKGTKGQTAMGLSLGGAQRLPTFNIGRTTDESAPDKGAATTVITDKLDLAATIGSAGLTAKNTRAFTNTPNDAANVTALNQEAGLNLALGGGKAASTAITANTKRAVTDAVDKTKDADVKTTTLALTTTSANKTQQASVSLTGGDSGTPTADQQTQGVSLKLQPGPALTLTVGKTEQKVTPLTKGTPGDSQTTTQQTASAELVPMAASKVTGAVQVTGQGETKSSRTDLSATLGSGKAIEIGGGITNRSSSVAGGLTLDTTRAQLAFRPTRVFTFSGAYTANPEANGAVSQAIRHELGLKARFGSLEFGSGYALTTLIGLPTVTDDPQFGEVSLTLGLQLDRYTKVNGNYKDGLLYGGGYSVANNVAPRGSRVYGLGITRTVGSSLSLSMNGTMTSDRTQATDPTAYKAEAKLGIHF